MGSKIEVTPLFAASLVYLAIVVIGGALILGLSRWFFHQFAFNRRQRFATAVETTLSPALTRLEEKIDENTIETRQIQARIARLELDQFGDNHGGMREAVNNTNAVARDLSVTMARVEGRLEQHLRESAHYSAPPQVEDG